MLTTLFRVSFPALLQPKYNGLNKKNEYSLTMLFDKRTAAKDLAAIKAEVEKVAKAKWPKGIPADLKSPFHDGDKETYKRGDKVGKPKAPGYYFLTAKSTTPPGVMKFDETGAKVKVLSPDDIYGGCFAIADVSVFAYDKGGNVGVSLGLNHVLKMKDCKPEERFSKRATLDEAFESVDAIESQAEEQPANSFSMGIE